VLPRADFDEIEAAVMETARGRWFLAEYARRNRSADTAAVLEALARLEARLAAGQSHTVPQKAVPALVPAPEPVREPEPEAPAPAPPIARADDLKAMAEELLRGSRLFDWVGSSDDASQSDPQAEPPAPESRRDPEPAPPMAVAPDRQGDKDLGGESEIDDQDFVEWETELTERGAPFTPVREATLPPPPRIAPLPPPAPPPAFARGMPPPPPFVRTPPPPPAIRNAAVADQPPRITAAEAPAPRPPVPPFSEMPEIAPKPVERPHPFERPAEPRQPLVARSSLIEPKPIPPGPRVDDPTLTMTRDEKLALFS
jgi:hypothetical protein